MTLLLWNGGSIFFVDGGSIFFKQHQQKLKNGVNFEFDINGWSKTTICCDIYSKNGFEFGVND